MNGQEPPEGVEEVEIKWDSTTEGTTVTVSCGDAQIVVSTTVDSGEESALPWLVSALPGILDAAWDAIQESEQPQEEE